jgi:hypothetical protein
VFVPGVVREQKGNAFVGAAAQVTGCAPSGVNTRCTGPCASGHGR